MTIKILAFDGSGRAASVNHRVVQHVVNTIKSDDVSVTEINLHDFQLPMYDLADEIEHGFPEQVQKLKALFREHDAFIIGSPEHNGSFTTQLKNAIDWVSRKATPDEAPLSGFKGKVIGLVAASPGKLGGLRGIYQLNTVLFGLGSLVLPEIVSIGFANDAFDEAGGLKNDPDKKAVAALAARMVQVTKALKA